MAAQLFFDPLVMLRAAPLLSSTFTFLFGWDQQFFLGLLNRPENRSSSKAMLQSYFTRFFRSGLVFVVGAIATSFWTGVANLYTRRASLEACRSHWWYFAGTSLAVGHLLYVPIIAPTVQALLDKPEGTDVNRSLDEWLKINKTRTLTVDLAAWVAFGVAAGKTLRA